MDNKQRISLLLIIIYLELNKIKTQIYILINMKLRRLAIRVSE